MPINTSVGKGVNYDGVLYDIIAPHWPVDVIVSEDRTRLWVNIGATCVLRICKIDKIGGNFKVTQEVPSPFVAGVSRCLVCGCLLPDHGIRCDECAGLT